MRPSYLDHRVQTVDRHTPLPIEVTSDTQKELRALLGAEDDFVDGPSSAMIALAGEALELVTANPAISAEELAERLTAPPGVQARRTRPAFVAPWLRRTVATVRRVGCPTVAELAKELEAPTDFTWRLVRILEHVGRLRVDS